MSKYRNRLRRNTNIYFVLAVLLVVLVSIFVVWPNYKLLVEKTTTLADLRTQIEKTEGKLNSSRDDYRLLKNDYASLAINNKTSIGVILPEEALQTSIVRELEKYVNKLKQSNLEISLNEVRFSRSESNKDVDYQTLPFKISLVATRAGLMDFLRHLENSGDLTTGTDKTARLLNATDINIKKNSETGKLNVDLSVNAYFLPTPTSTDQTQDATN